MNEVTDDSAEIDLRLFQFGSTDKALFLSPGSIATAKWIPRRFAKQSSETHYLNRDGTQAIEAIFSIARWKAKELGWLTSEDEGQGRLAL